MYEVVNSVWFNRIGIVRVRPEYGDDKFYIGEGAGFSQEADEQSIAERGMPFYPEYMQDFFKQ